MKFRSQTEHILPINLFYSSFSFFSADEDSTFQRFQISGHKHREIQNRLNTFSTFQSVVYIMVKIVFEFGSYIFSDLFPLFNMLATAITSEPSRQARDGIRKRAYYETNKDALKNKKNSDSISKLKWKSKPIDFRKMKLPHWIFLIDVLSPSARSYIVTSCLMLRWYTKQRDTWERILK